MAETYELDEYVALAGEALDKLRTGHSPGGRSRRGGKAAVLRAVRDRLLTLSGEGYTTGQMADTLRGVIPSMTVRAVRAALREAAREGAAGKKGRKRKSARGIRAGTAGTGDSPSTGVTTETAPDGAMSATARSDVPIAGPPPARTEAATATDAGTCADAAAPAIGTGAGLTPEQRTQYRIPDWADGSDLRPGEELAAYARRKRVAGDPAQPIDPRFNR